MNTASQKPFQPPSWFNLLLATFYPAKMLASPVNFGLERIPDTRPLLFVGNHTLLGLLDTPFLFAELYREKGIFLRALGDHGHFNVPLWGKLLTSFGVVDGTRANCAKLMQDGETVLVFPGGAREVNKRKGEKYKLIWGDRVGFARLAIQNHCTIVPFSAVGADDAFEIVLDAGDMLNSNWLGDKILEKAGKRAEVMMPLVRGVGLTPLPRIERLYFYFGDPICTDEYDGDGDNRENCVELRNKTQAAIEEGLRFLLDHREGDPDRKPIPRLLSKVRRR